MVRADRAAIAREASWSAIFVSGGSGGNSKAVFGACATTTRGDVAGSIPDEQRGPRAKPQASGDRSTGADAGDRGWTLGDSMDADEYREPASARCAGAA